MTSASPTSAPLSVVEVSKKFIQGGTSVRALDRVSLTVQHGEFVAVMGASGSGKSTLLHVMAGLTNFDSGQLRVAGQDIARFSDRQLTHFRRDNIGLVFQAFNLIPSLTAEQNIVLPIVTAGRSAASKRAEVESLLAQLGLSQRRNHRPDALSGGEQQRVAIARALIANPAIVLADEPTGSLDSTTGQSICKLLRQLCTDQHRTIVLVTHEPSVAVWADRVVVLRDGRNLTEFATAGFPNTQALAAHYQDVVSTEPLEKAAAVH